jgi:hypothetical protein
MITSWMTASGTVVIALGLPVAYVQLRATRRVAQADAVTRLNSEWRGSELYEAWRYIERLGEEWAASGLSTSDCAHEWVRVNVQPLDPAHSNEWGQRRALAQHLRNVGYLMHAKYLTADDVFAVMPEMPRVLPIVRALEAAIIDHYGPKHPDQSEFWDRPAYKWELDVLARQFNRWSKKRIVLYRRGTRGERAFNRSRDDKSRRAIS